MQRLIRERLVSVDEHPNTWKYGSGLQEEVRSVLKGLDRIDRLKQLGDNLTKEYIIKIIQQEINASKRKALRVYDEMISEGYLWDDMKTIGWINIIEAQRYDMLMGKSNNHIKRRFPIQHDCWKGG